MQDHTVTLIVAVAGIAGTFGSGFFTQWMARASQQEQRLFDCRREEFRELLDALSNSLTTVLDRYGHMRTPTPEDQEKVADAKATLFRVIHSRIFIAHDIEQVDFEVKWNEEVKNYVATRDVDPLVGTYREITRSLVKIAATTTGEAHRKGRVLPSPNPKRS